MHQKNLSLQGRETIERDFIHSARFYRALLKKYLPTSKNIQIMDIPCGEGRMIYVLKTMGYNNVSGYDLDKQRLKTARKLNLHVNEGDVFQVLAECDNDSIDCLFTMDFLEHLEKKNVIFFLQQAFDKITPGGTLFVRMPCASNPFGIRHIYNDFTHKWAATHGVLWQLLHATGFSSVVVFGEEPNIGMRLGFLRVACFCFARFMANCFLRCLGQMPVKIWTSSMWAVARK
jgi:SAM-dependent methyltransferase